MLNKSILLIVLSLLVFTSSCSSFIRNGYNSYEYDPTHISIKYPKDWENKTEQMEKLIKKLKQEQITNNQISFTGQILLAIRSPLENSYDKFQESVTIEKYTYDDILSSSDKIIEQSFINSFPYDELTISIYRLNNFYSYIKNNTINGYKNFKSVINSKLIAEGMKNINYNAGKWFIYTLEVNGKKTKIKSYVICCTPRKKEGIVFHAGSTEEDFSRFEPLFDEIVSTLKTETDLKQERK